MAFFVENPLRILFIGVVVEAVLGMMLLRTGRGMLLWAMLGAACLFGLWLGVERLVVTDREAVERTLDDAVKAARKNDINGLLACIAPSAKRARDLSIWVLNCYEVEEGHMISVEIKVNRLTSPPTAKATFTAVGRARARDRRNELPYRGSAQQVIVDLRKMGDRWLVTDYDLPNLPTP
jgi:hypothetical protein